MFFDRLACGLAWLALACGSAAATQTMSMRIEPAQPVAVVSLPGQPKITVPVSLLRSARSATGIRHPVPSAPAQTPAASGASETRLSPLRMHQRTSSRISTRQETQSSAGVPIPTGTAAGRPNVVAGAVPVEPPSQRPRAVTGGWTPQAPFTVHADIQSYVHELRESIPVNLGDSPIRRDVYLITSGYGLYPLAGPHIIAQDPSYTRRHLAKLRHDVAWHVPENQPVLCVIDWESWWPVWEKNQDEPSPAGPEAIDLDFQTDWRDHIRQNRPRLIEGLSPEEQEQIFKQTFEQEAKRFFLATLAECKRIRPRATWGVYALPFRSYWDYRDEEKAATLRKHNDDLAWLWPAVDFIAPSIYCFYKSCESGCENTPAEDRAYIEANLAEALRVAEGKPVYAYIWGKYHSSNPRYGSQFLNEVNLTNRFQIPFEMGLDGVILFELIRTDAEAREFETYFDQSIVPEIDRVLTAPR